MLLIHPFGASAAQPELPGLEETDYPGWENIDTRRLPTGCAVDEDSLFWLCTKKGLLRIEKRSGAKTFFRPTKHGRSNDLIQSLAADGRGGLWLGMEMGGLAHFNGTEWQSVPLPETPGFSLQNVDVAVDIKGRLWVHGYDQGNLTRTSPGLFLLEGETWKILGVDRMPTGPGSASLNKSPWAMALDTAGHAWVVSQAGLYEYDDSTWMWCGEIPAVSLIGKLIVSPDGGKWIHSSEKYGDRVFLSRKESSWTQLDLTTYGKPNYFSLGLGADGEVWISCSLGLVRMKGAESKVFNANGWTFAPASGTGMYLVGSYSISLIKDSLITTSYELVPLQGNIRAIGMDGMRGVPMLATDAGSVRLGIESWLKLPDPPKNPDTSRFHFGYKASTLAYDRHGTPWLGDFDGAFKWKDTAWSLTPLQERTSKVAFGLDDAVWSGSAGAPYVYRLDSTGVTVFNGANSPFTGWIYDLLVDKSGTVWASDDNGMYAYDGQKWKSFPSMLGNRIYAMARDSSGTIWGGGRKLWRIRGNEIGNVSLPAELEFTSVLHIVIDPRDDIWLGTYDKGLWQFNGSQWQSFTTRNSGMLSDSISCMAIHPSGILWIGGPNGLTLMDIPVAAPLRPNRIETNEFRIFSLPSGIRYTLSSDAVVRYFISDGLGRIHVNNRLDQKAGEHFLPIQPVSAPSFIRLSTPEFSRTLLLSPGKSR